MATMAIPISKNLDAEMTDFLSIISENTSFMNKNQAKQLGEIQQQRKKEEELNESLDKFSKKYIDQIKQGKITKNKYYEIMSNYEKIFMELQKQGEDEKNRQNKIETLKFKSEMSSGFMKKYYDRQLEYMEIDEKFNERNAQILEMQQAGKLSPTEARQLQFKNKMNKMYDKWLIKGNFFKNVLGTLKDIAKGVWDAAEGWIIKLLKFLFIMAIFDPDGKFLASIMDMITKAVVWMINILASYLPRIVKSFINLVVNVFPPLLVKMVQGIFPAIGKLFESFAKSLEKDYPIIGWIFKQVAKLFAKDGVLYTFFSFLARNFPIIVAILGVKKLITFLGPVTKMLSGFGGVLFKLALKIFPTFMVKFGMMLGLMKASLLSLASTVGAAILPFLPLIAVLGALAYVGYKLFNTWKDSAKIFKRTEKAMSKMNEKQKFMYRMKMNPFDQIGRAFEVFKKKGLGAAIGEFTKKYTMAWDLIKKSKFGMDIQQKGIIGTATEYGGKAIDSVMFQLDRFGKWLKESFFGTLDSIFAWFSAIALDPIGYITSIAAKSNYSEKLYTAVLAYNKMKQIKAEGGQVKGDNFIAKAVRAGKEITKEDVENASLPSLKVIAENTKEMVEKMSSGNNSQITSMKLNVSAKADNQR